MAIEYILKRNGKTEAFDPSKLNGWGEWASKNLGKEVDWGEVVLHAYSTNAPVTNSDDLQNSLINFCLTKESFSYNRMAGRLYVGLLYKQIYNDNIPTIKTVFQNLVDDGLMSESFFNSYSNSDYYELEKIIDHKRDLTYAHYQIKQNLEKYSLHNRVDKIYYETPQFSYIRVAMRMCQNKGFGLDRIERIKRHYNKYSSGINNIPTPYFTNSGTNRSGFASCNVHRSKDTIGSLATSDHISYMMTVGSAGQGSKIYARTLGSPVKGGSIIHSGKINYYKAQVAMINANLQNGRGGAETQSYDCYDPEWQTIQKFKNQLTPLARQVRGLDYSMCFNEFFVKQASQNKNIALLDYAKFSDLYESIPLTDGTFEKLYNQYLEEGKFDNFVNAREVLLGALEEALDTGRHYYCNLTEMNTHTPFKDPIYQSNLCVAPETMILTKNGYEMIGELEDQDVVVWNGKEWSETTVRKTGDNQELFDVIVRVKVGDLEWEEKVISCTEYHKWYDVKGNELRTNELELNLDLLVWFDTDGNKVISYVSEIRDDGRFDSTFCVNESKRHKVVFNGVLTGQCQEIALPTKPFKHVYEMYYAQYLDDLNVPKEMKDYYQELIDSDDMGEVATCSLAAIAVGKIKSDEEYREAAWVALDMIHTGITESDYMLPNVGYTSKKRMSAGVGIVDLAHDLARYKLKYDTQEGRDHIHKVAERHYYWLLEASLELSKEFGNAEWMHKTKWTDENSWLPIDTYNKNVDELITVDLQYDWEDLRSRIIENKGHAFSVLCCHMPGESSTISSASTNGIYPVRDLSIKKTNETLSLSYVAPDLDKLHKYYQSAWDIEVVDMVKVYGILQKFCDQTISADVWYKVKGGETIKSNKLLSDFFAFIRYGVKTRYYTNSNTSKNIDLNATEKIEEVQEEIEVECEGCKI